MIATEIPCEPNEIKLTRTFNAPRHLVWKAMTDPTLVGKWWGPNGFTSTIEVMDFRVGGQWKHTMHGPDGTNYPNNSIFREIVLHEKIVYELSGGKENVQESHFVSTWLFEEVNANTTQVTIFMSFPTAEERNAVCANYGAIEGGKQTLGRLADFLASESTKTCPNGLKSPFVANHKLVLKTLGDNEIVFTRSFHAKRELVWKAITTPELVKRWLLGPPGWTMPVCEIDLRVGGRYRYLWRNAEGTDMGMGGVYKEVVAPEKIVQTELFDQDWTGGETLGTSILTEAAGLTTLSITVKYSSTVARDGVLKTGMEQGMAMGYDRLEGILDTL